MRMSNVEKNKKIADQRTLAYPNYVILIGSIDTCVGLMNLFTYLKKMGIHITVSLKEIRIP